MRLGHISRRIGAYSLFVLLSFVLPLINCPASASDSVAARDLGAPLAIDAARDLEFPFVPDPLMTKGSLCDERDPDFSYLRYEEQIPYCKRNVSKGERNDIYDAYGVPEKCRKDYTIDHFIPLSIGGTNHRDNLWPEHKSIKALRMELENDLYKKMSLGAITQKEAVRIVTEAKWNPPVRNPGNFKICH